MNTPKRTHQPTHQPTLNSTLDPKLNPTFNRAIVSFKRLDPNATLPAYQSAEAAGLDLSACLPQTDPAQQPTLTIEPGRIAVVPCGFAMAIPRGHEGQVRPRSGLATKHGLTLPNAPGTIDSDYRGEVKVPLINLGQQPYTITQGQRIAQLVIAPVTQAVVVEVSELEDTARGAGGFGSTGMKA